MTSLYILFGLLALYILLRILFRPRKAEIDCADTEKDSMEAKSVQKQDDCDGLCGTCAAVCDIEKRLAPPEYFDDEELDAFSGRDAAEYTDAEADLFAEVLHTMQPHEVRDWLISLETRRISLPNQLKDEVFLLMSD